MGCLVRIAMNRRRGQVAVRNGTLSGYTIHILEHAARSGEWTEASHSDPQEELAAPPAAAAPAPMPCNFSPTFLFTSKNLATQRSMQTLSPLFRSPSAYLGLMHLVWHELRRHGEIEPCKATLNALCSLDNLVEDICYHVESKAALA